MAAQTGRTLPRFTTVWLDNSVGTLTQLVSVNSLAGLGLDSEVTELSAWADQVRGVILGVPGFSMTMGGTFDTADYATLTGVNNLNTPLSLDIRIGIRHTWESGEPHFGITSTASNGVLVHGFVVNPGNMTWSCTVEVCAGSTTPAWSTGAAFT